ncbi:stress-response A/B barrel domain-containing protein UP3-like protein, partial [Tanacetum coccineum]
MEHVVHYKVKSDVDYGKVASMVNELSSLTSLNLTVHVSAGKLLRSQSFTTNLHSHASHSLQSSMDDLRKYKVHSEHLHLRIETVRHIIDDVMSVDWISNCASV